MWPTLHDGQSALVIKCAYGIRKPRNLFEIPLLGSLLFTLSTEHKVDSVLKLNKSFKYLFSSLPKRGDIVALNIPSCNRNRAVKRCMAIAGDALPDPHPNLPYDTIPYKGMIIDAKNLTYMQKEYLQHHREFRFDDKDSTYVAIDDFVYVIGDNEGTSEDSRRWGPIAMNLIFGRVIGM